MLQERLDIADQVTTLITLFSMAIFRDVHKWESAWPAAPPSPLTHVSCDMSRGLI